MKEKHSFCILCNSKDLVELDKYKKNYLVQCKSCDFVFCSKIPSLDELIAHYKTYPRGSFISPITIKRYNEILDDFEKYRKTNKMLDIGCGDGFFLEAAKKRGWDVHGTEFTDEAIENCVKRDISMKKGILQAENYKKEDFDIITSFEVIEHINNPKEEIQNILAILRKGGLFYFTTPNFNSISRFILKENWNVIEYPEHLSYYTPKTINSFLIQNGFNKIKLETTGFSINRFEKGMQETSGKPIFKINKDEELREKTEKQLFFKLIKKTVNEALNLFKIGDSLKGSYQKK
ncbi:MAG: Methyltransferase type 11 [Bacteroidetes bacterium]|jgi:2-polyprenyl-3-methyl-5-hydroxy-6-metoxy-1,4-benzoquinol methylase|nr:Methyltransferase type 11 [Bacteroidota bacterium]